MKAVSAALLLTLSAFALAPASLRAASAITVTTLPQSQTVTTGSTVVFSVVATSPAPLSYQWAYAGANVANATLPRLVVTNAGASNAGDYTCTITTADGGSTTTWAATLTVAASSDPGRLSNLSVLTSITSGGLLTVGFTSGGAGTSGSQTLLIRAIGPALSLFGLSPVVSDPTLTVFQQTTHAQVAANDNWGSNQTQVNTAIAATGAFALPSATSLDAALVATLPAPQAYSAQVTANGGGSGSVLAEFYDDSGTYTAANPRLINVSTLSQVAAGNSLSAGFVISGNTAKTVLIRAVGPSLGALGVTGTMTDPKLTLFQSQGGSTPVQIANNAGWGGDAQIAAAAANVGAFALGSGSADSAILITLLPQSPGGMYNYSAQATSASGGAGAVLVEVYEVP